MADNVLLIQTDQMHFSCLSMLGHPVVRTPNLDRLAREGVLFANATANNPICMPSRVSMLSGQYCSTLRQYGFSGLCDARTPWLQGAFKRAHYRTGAFGKFHVLSIGQEQWDFDVAAPSLPEDNDLARPFGQNYMSYCQEQGVPWPTDQMHGHNPFGPYQGPPSSATPEMHYMRARSCKSDVPVEHSLETWTTDRCLDFLRDSAGTRQPFFAWLTYDRPHFPTTLPEPWFSSIRPERVPLQPMPDAEQWTRLPPSWFHNFTHGNSVATMGEEAFRFTLATYFACIEWIDAEIGRVLGALAESGLDANTTIAFTADHGDEAGWHGLYNKTRFMTSEAITRVPLIVRPAPASEMRQRGRIITEPVELVDLAPTLCALAGTPIPERVEGRNLAATIRHDEPLDPHRPVFCEDYWVRMVTRDGWKLVFDPCHETENTLFDLRNDPENFDNRYLDPACLEKRIELKRVLLAFLMERLYGPYSRADIERIERGLDDADPTLSPVIGTSTYGLQYYRAAALINDDAHILIVPFYDDGKMRLFPPKTKVKYPTNRDALPFDTAIAERFLDKALKDCYPRLSSVSLLMDGNWHHGSCDHPRPTAAEARAVLSKLDASAVPPCPPHP